MHQQLLYQIGNQLNNTLQDYKPDPIGIALFILMIPTVICSGYVIYKEVFKHKPLSRWMKDKEPMKEKEAQEMYR